MALDFGKSIYWLYEELSDYRNVHAMKISTAIYTIVMYLFCLLIFILIVMFYEFHKKLVRENKTTIENLEHKNEKFDSKYDMGYEYNYTQVYGTNSWFDFIPIMPSSAKPKGDGIYFQKNAETEDSDDEGEENTGNSDNRNPAIASAAPKRNSNTIPQNTAEQNVDRPAAPSSGSEKNARQGDVMTIHNDRSSQYRNLNNIVRSDNPAQDFKSNESEDPQSISARQLENSKKQYVNKISNREYEDLK